MFTVSVFIPEDVHVIDRHTVSSKKTTAMFTEMLEIDKQRGINHTNYLITRHVIEA